VQPEIKEGQKCPRHSLLVHSYLREDSRDLLCTKCIYERNLTSRQTVILKSVVRNIKASIESTKLMIFHRRSQLTNAMRILAKNQRTLGELAETQLSEYFTRIRVAIDSEEARLRTKIEEASKK
jgi:hypothetical protein